MNPVSHPEAADILIRVDNVSKKFCRSLKKSLAYGLLDIAAELNPWQMLAPAHDPGRQRPLREAEFWAVRNVSFELRRGECLGLVGHNGAGKSTLLRLLNGLIKPDSGRIQMRGRISALIALGAGFNSILTGRENIFVNGAVLGLGKADVKTKIEEIVDFAEIGEFIDTPVQSYSTGMQMRLGFAIATALRPDVLLIDEVLAVGDAAFRFKCIKRIGEIITQCAVVFVSHDAYQVRRICDAVLRLRTGSAHLYRHVEEAMHEYAMERPAGLPPLKILAADYIADVQADGCISTRPDATGELEVTDVEIRLSFHSERAAGLGLRLGNIYAQDEHVAGQFEFSRWMEQVRFGSNEFRFRAVGIQLAKGRYSVNLSIYDEGNKNIVLSLRHLVHFEVEGNVRYGPTYAIATAPPADWT